MYMASLPSSVPGGCPRQTGRGCALFRLMFFLNEVSSAPCWRRSVCAAVHARRKKQGNSSIAGACLQHTDSVRPRRRLLRCACTVSAAKRRHAARLFFTEGPCAAAAPLRSRHAGPSFSVSHALAMSVHRCFHVMAAAMIARSRSMPSTSTVPYVLCVTRQRKFCVCFCIVRSFLSRSARAQACRS